MTLDPEELDVMGPGWEEHRESRRVHRERWGVRAAEWKSLELAREVFGEGASVRLARYPARGAFSGLVSLEVPFTGLDDHQVREKRFLSMVGVEPVLEQVRLVYVFEPVPAAGPLPSLGAPPIGDSQPEPGPPDAISVGRRSGPAVEP